MCSGYITYSFYIQDEGDHLAIDKNKNKQVLVTFPIELLNQIEDYRFENRKPNRNTAILDLIKEGLQAAEKNIANDKKNQSK